MDPDSQSTRRCDCCGSREDLYLLTPRSGDLQGGGEAYVRCGRCRQDESIDVAIPVALLTPRLLLGLQRLRKLAAISAGSVETIPARIPLI